jgi:hypothetical protein
MGASWYTEADVTQLQGRVADVNALVDFLDKLVDGEFEGGIGSMSRITEKVRAAKTRRREERGHCCRQGMEDPIWYLRAFSQSRVH